VALVPFTAGHALHAWSAVCYSFIVISRPRVFARFTARRRSVGGILALLFVISVGGQQLPCVHAGVDAPAAHTPAAHTPHDVSVDPSMPMTTDVTPSAPMHHHGSPSSNRSPVAPGCAQLMVCGLVVQGNVVTTSFSELTAAAVEVPTGRHLQYATADREVESPPPRG